MIRGYMRLIERLMMQGEHGLIANQLSIVTQDAIKVTRENLIIGFD